MHLRNAVMPRGGPVKRHLRDLCLIFLDDYIFQVNSSAGTQYLYFVQTNSNCLLLSLLYRLMDEIMSFIFILLPTEVCKAYCKRLDFSCLTLYKILSMPHHNTITNLQHFLMTITPQLVLNMYILQIADK